MIEVNMLDIIIVSMYLFVMLYIGFTSSASASKLKDFSISNKKYGTFILLATLSASFIGGGFSTGNASKVATYGIGNIFALCGFSVAIMLVGQFLVPNIRKFRNVISTGDVMKESYGLKSQIITGVLSFIFCSGILAAQVGVVGYILNIFLGLDLVWGAILGCLVVILYSTIGGMSAVVKTDVIQFLVLGIGMPVLLIISFLKVGSVENIISVVPSEFLYIFNGYTIIGFISLFLTFAIGESLAPPYVQRLMMGRDIKTTQKATVYSGLLSIPFFIITGLIGLAGYAYYNGEISDVNSVMQLMIKDVVPVGLKGFMIAGILSVSMSSADSFLNSAAVAIVNDIILPIKQLANSKKEATTKAHVIDDSKVVSFAKFVNFLTGAVAILIAIFIPNVLDMLVFAYSFWSPVMVVPLAAALLGYEGKDKIFEICMIAGIVSTVIWTYALKMPGNFDGTIIGTFVNLIVFLMIYKKYGKFNKVDKA